MLELPTQSEFVRAVREREIQHRKIVAWIGAGIGCVLFLVGFFFFRALMQTSANWVWLAWMPIAVLAIVDSACRWLRPLRCGNCHYAIKDEELAIALHACPHCHKKIFHEEAFDHISLPELRYDSRRMGIYILLLNFLFILVMVKWPSSTENGFDMVGCLQGVLMFSGCLLILFPFVGRFFKGTIQGGVRLAKPSEQKCPICGEKSHFMHLRYTGNCSICGSKIDPEWSSDTSAISEWSPTWEQIQNFQKKNRMKDLLHGCIFLACVTLPVFTISFLTIKSDWLFFLALAVGGVIGIVFINKTSNRTDEKFDALVKCPCMEKIPPPNFQSNREMIATYGICPACRRKLVRDDDARKGARG